ncbi:hypothetical protein Ssi03_71890 [Sphaerisporangium siamense]|uniref:Putative zinc-finger domain-containing protein n=1 Tax=Sphaerisporangium siamense TaxID=795645 RepID=A0A7W7GC60_9ACTN|nr:zf-HC2 domain-containing protein [Sphaerisporangium siamense]MBB4703179.1 hypothetical protein [Sphaerisporangium siamense]GII89199.1 hypothetical protein Ssi03_71890 [Sphaerisporangium siamense]
MTGLMGSPPHADVAAYILGVLDEEDSEAFEGHLLDCPSCQDELREMYALPDALDLIRGDVIGAPRATAHGAAPGARPAGSVNGAAHGSPGVIQDPRPPGCRSPRRRHAPPRAEESREEITAARARRHRAVALGVAAVLFIGVTGGVAASRLWPGIGGTTVAAPTGAPAATEFREGASPGTGVSGKVGLTPRSWGTEVAFQLSGVTGPERCSLVAVSRGGDTDVVSGWRIRPGDGFGVPGHPGPLRLTGATALATAEIARFEVRRDDGVRLLEIPVT